MGHDVCFWATDSEIAWLNGLGSHCDNNESRHRNPANRMSKLELLGLYLASCEHREKWGKIEKEKIIAHLKTMLSEMANGNHNVEGYTGSGVGLEGERPSTVDTVGVDSQEAE